MAEPAALATGILCCLLIVAGIKGVYAGNSDYFLIILGCIGTVYAVVLFYVIMPSPKRLQLYKWPIVIANAALISIGIYVLSGNLRTLLLIIMVLISVVMLILWDRGATYVFIGLSGILYLLLTVGKASLSEFVNQAVIFLMAVIIVETIERLYASSQKRVMRLQAINEFARHVSISLDVREVAELVGKSIRDALQADTYFFGLVYEI